jgi:hypothetical protein
MGRTANVSGSPISDGPEFCVCREFVDFTKADSTISGLLLSIAHSDLRPSDLLNTQDLSMTNFVTDPLLFTDSEGNWRTVSVVTK